jgi:LysM repeat protein
MPHAQALLLGNRLVTAQAVDTGPRHHAQSQYDTLTATYVVVEGDDLIEIGKRFEVSVDELKARGKLTSDKIEVGQRLAIAAGTTAMYGRSGPVPMDTGFPVTRAI